MPLNAYNDIDKFFRNIIPKTKKVFIINKKLNLNFYY